MTSRGGECGCFDYHGEAQIHAGTGQLATSCVVDDYLPSHVVSLVCALRSVDHPGLLPVVDAHLDSGTKKTLVVVYDISGGYITLHDAILSGEWPPASFSDCDAARAINFVLSALQILHSVCGKPHGAISTKSIFVSTSSKLIKIGGFTDYLIISATHTAPTCTPQPPQNSVRWCGLFPTPTDMGVIKTCTPSTSRDIHSLKEVLLHALSHSPYLASTFLYTSPKLGSDYHFHSSLENTTGWTQFFSIMQAPQRDLKEAQQALTELFPVVSCEPEFFPGVLDLDVWIKTLAKDPVVTRNLLHSMLLKEEDPIALLLCRMIYRHYPHSVNDLIPFNACPKEELLHRAKKAPAHLKQRAYQLLVQHSNRTPVHGFLLALLYDYGIGTPRDVGKAASLYKGAGKQGLSAATRNLGYCYERGDGVPKNETKAWKYYKRAESAGNITALFDIGCCYEWGVGVPADSTMAFEYLKKAASLGDSGAAYSLACMYWDPPARTQPPEQQPQSITPVPTFRDAPNALHWFQIAADRGCSDAQRQLGMFYFTGDIEANVTQDVSKAMQLFSLSAAQGNSISEVSLGMCFEQGVGSGPDLDKAKYWYTKACDQDSALAFLLLGSMSITGHAKARDLREGLRLIRLSVQLGGAKTLAKSALVSEPSLDALF
ncbi:HcpA family protein [Pelomyxa schiedti]|nr:HcpA family protein [Pelomyxa schiedti]